MAKGSRSVVSLRFFFIPERYDEMRKISGETLTVRSQINGGALRQQPHKKPHITAEFSRGSRKLLESAGSVGGGTKHVFSDVSHFPHSLAPSVRQIVRQAL